ncbi:18212_t:CDS:2 [Gigaspora margarita]|uniref:18212_t:CDS:1 n=1 Tax=Gigaspora margarita TaxID=4874 RepID=A0ABN7VDR2_GIGMA|nr:18212_t:CDS:2 [Gigaspora margarita]
MNNKKKYKNYKIKHALITVINCKRCSEVFKYTKTNVKDDPFCKRCDQNHVHCRYSCKKCCKRFQYNDLKCKNCTENGFECERTMIKTREQFDKINELGEKTRRFYEQCYIQLSSWMSFKKIKEILENNSLNIKNNFYGGSQSATDIKNYSLKNYTRCTVHRNCRCDYFDLNVHCDICDDSCKEFCELLIVHDNKNLEEIFDEAVDDIFNKKSELIEIFYRKKILVKNIVQLERLYKLVKEKDEMNELKNELYYNSYAKLWNNNARYVIIDDFLFLRNNGSKPCIILLNELVNPCNFESKKFLKELYKNCLIIKLGNFDLRKKDEEGNLTNQFLLDGRTETISYFDSLENENKLILTLEDFEYDYILNYNNENRKNKRRLNYDAEEFNGIKWNIKNTRYMGIFPNENVVNDWYNAILELKKKNPGDENYMIEKILSDWYTLQGSDNIIRLIYNVHKKELKEFKEKCFWILIGDVNGFGGRDMPIFFNNSGSTDSGSSNTNTGSDTTNTGSNTTNIGGGNTGTGSNTTTAMGSNINNNLKLALDEIFKNLEMDRTNNDQKDLEWLRKVSKNIASLIQNINK